MMTDWTNRRRRPTKSQSLAYIRFVDDRQRALSNDTAAVERLVLLSQSFPDDWMTALNTSLRSSGWEDFERKMGWPLRSGSLALFLICDGLSYFYKNEKLPDTIG